MNRRLRQALLVLVGAMIFSAVVLWPAKARKPPPTDESLTIHLATAGTGGRSVSGPATRAAPPPTTTQPLVWDRPRFAEFRTEREQMVRTQIAESWAGRQRVKDPRVLAAMRQVPRHLFVEKGKLAGAHADHPLPIGYGQTISQPYMGALMTEALRLQPGAKVLEIGTGSGYQAAVLSEITPHVYTIEIIEPLHKRAGARLATLGYKTVRCRQGDGYHGWPEEAPFDGIIVTCAAGHIPPPLYQQLSPGGRMVIPIGQPGMYQQLKVVTRDAATGRPRYETICGVAFVPMVGRIEQP